jgi:hypothetical protein
MDLVSAIEPNQIVTNCSGVRQREATGALIGKIDAALVEFVTVVRKKLVGVGERGNTSVEVANRNEVVVLNAIEVERFH